MTAQIAKTSQVRGRVGLWHVRRNLWTPRASCPNQLQYGWGSIMTQLLSGQRTYRISGMYVEFENVTLPTDTVTPPSYGPEEGLEYYDNLQLSATKDFLRVSLLQSPLITSEAGFEAYFTEGVTGNIATLVAMSAGTQGVHGKTFGDLVNSKVYGAALVATPVLTDRAQDVIFARTYFATADQVLKEASHQIGLTWDVTFECA